jgi:uncharacterized membrane protein YsdA (DUF1294 family)
METIALYTTGIASIVAFVLYASDKFLAKADMWRIPEAVLLGTAFVGGAFGALLAMRIFRHKTRKRIFTIGVPMMLLLHLSVLGAVLF